jgi:hypothetical protein
MRLSSMVTAYSKSRGMVASTGTTGKAKTTKAAQRRIKIPP